MTALDTPEAIREHVRKTMGRSRKLCPDCDGLGAFVATGEDCGNCYGGGSVPNGPTPSNSTDPSPAVEAV